MDSIDPFGTGTVAASNNIFDTARVRMDNTVMYSLDAAGFTGSLAYSFGEQTTGISASAAYGARLGYANGPINVQLAYHDANNTTNTGDYKVAFMGGTYNFGVAKIHAAYEKTDADAGIYGSVARTALDSNTYLLGASAPIGAGTLMASWIRNDNKLLNVDTDQYGIGYAHQLSKRTAVYTTYARTKIDRAADDIDRFQVGYQHKF